MRNGISDLVKIAILLSAAGGAIRCISFLDPKASWALPVVGFAQTLIALAGPIVMAAPPKLSARWFPVHERTIATAISSCANNIGSGVGYVVPPYLVQVYGFRNYLLIEAAIGALLLILVLTYFPESPPTPPSITAKLDQESSETFTLEIVKHSLVEIMWNPSYLLLSLVGGWQAGTLNAWQGLFENIFVPAFSETFVGWLGFFFITASSLGGIIGGFLCDKFLQKKFKKLLIIVFTLLSVCLLVFTLSFPTFFSPEPLINLHPYVSASMLVICGLLYGFCSPIFYEFGVEITYPLSPIMSSGFLTLWINVFTLVFLVSRIPNTYINAITAFSMFACIIPLILVKESYKRSDIDMSVAYQPTN